MRIPISCVLCTIMMGISSHLPSSIPTSKYFSLLKVENWSCFFSDLPQVRTQAVLETISSLLVLLGQVSNFIPEDRRFSFKARMTPSVLCARTFTMGTISTSLNPTISDWFSKTPQISTSKNCATSSNQRRMKEKPKRRKEKNENFKKRQTFDIS